MPDRAPTFELAFQLSGELVGREMLTEEDLKGLSEEETEAKLRKNAALLAEVYTLLAHDAICIQYLNPAHIARTAALLREMTGDRFLLLAHGDGALAIPDGDGMYELRCALYEEPEALKEKCRRRADEVIARNDALLDGGLDGFILCSDYCFNQGPFMSPAMFSEFVAPCLRDIIAAIRKKGGYAIKHTDGNIMPILDQLVDCRPPCPPFAGSHGGGGYPAGEGEGGRPGGAVRERALRRAADGHRAGRDRLGGVLPPLRQARRRVRVLHQQHSL